MFWRTPTAVRLCTCQILHHASNILLCVISNPLLWAGVVLVYLVRVHIPRHYVTNTLGQHIHVNVNFVWMSGREP